MTIRLRTCLSVFCLVAAGFPAAPPAYSHVLDPAADSYLQVKDRERLEAYMTALRDAGESTTGRLYDYTVGICPVSMDGTGNTARSKIHVVQDRGLGQGETFSTYVLTSAGLSGPLLLTGMARAETQLYIADPADCAPGQCTISAKIGFTDICLADGFGNPAESADGLRRDLWTAFLRMLGL